MRYSLKEVFNSPVMELAKFKSRTETSNKCYCNVNNLAVSNDEETVVGVNEDSGETLFIYWLIILPMQTIYKL